MKSAIDTTSKPLTFGELAEGDKFITFPTDGDDSGHGGFRGEFNVFVKIRCPRKAVPGDVQDNAFGLANGTHSNMPNGMHVIRVRF